MTNWIATPPGKSENATADQLAVGRSSRWTDPRSQFRDVSEDLDELVDLSLNVVAASRVVLLPFMLVLIRSATDRVSRSSSAVVWDSWQDLSVGGRGIDRVDSLAEWSAWEPLVNAIVVAPRLPGVYTARQGPAGPIIYVGMAGERAGRDGRRAPQGIRGRLAVYASGKGAVSGLGEAAFDRALADPAWIELQLARMKEQGPQRAKAWAQAALEWAEIYIRWATVMDRRAASELERRTLAALDDQELWNRAR